MEELSQTERDRVTKGVGDYQSVDLEGSDQQTGQVRYETVDGKILFSVSADLPVVSSGMYQVWLKSPESGQMKPAFVLESTKGGYQGSASISADILPVEIVVTQELVNDQTPETVVMKGLLTK